MSNTATKQWLTLIGIGLASFLGCIDLTIVNTALPSIQLDLQASMTQLQWIITVFLLALCAFMVIMGRAADRYGRRLVLYIGMAGFGLSSLGVGLSSSMHILLLCRFIQGVCTAILYTASGAIISHTFPENQRGKAMGILFGINGIGLAIGPVLGGIIIGALSWRWVFLINVPLIILSFLICTPNVSESKNTEDKNPLDIKGALLLAIGLSSLILALVEGPVFGLHSSLILSLIIVCAVSLVSLYWVEKHTAEPIIDFALFCNRGFSCSLFATAALAFFYCLALFLMPMYLHNMLGLSNYQLGFMLLPTTAVMAILSPIVGRATDRLGPKPLLVFGAIFFVISAVLQMQLTSHSSLSYIILAFSAMGVGWAAILGPSTIAALSFASDKMAGTAMGTAWTMHNVGGVIGIALGTVVYHHFSALALHQGLMTHATQLTAHLTDSIIANPEQAIATLTSQAALSVQQATEVFQQFFMRGYHSAMLLLAGISAISAIVCLIIMPNSNKAK